MNRALGVLSLLVAFLPAPARADSDGYYCTGPGYLAYEIRFSHGTSEHLLHIVRFSVMDGITAQASVPLDDFQVQSMTCGSADVVLIGGGHRSTVTLPASDAPRVTATPAAQIPSGSLANLGHWATPGVTDLTSDGRPGEFQLVIARVSRQTPGGIEHYTLTTLIRRADMPEARLQSVPLFEGVFLETVD